VGELRFLKEEPMTPNLSRCATLYLATAALISCSFVGTAAQGQAAPPETGPKAATGAASRTKPWHLVRIPDPLARRATVTALEEASARFGNVECRNVLTDFEDRDGRSLAERLAELGVDIQRYVAMVTFLDDSRHRRCTGGVVAFTAPGSRVVRVCADELRRIHSEAPEYLMAVIIHEILHTLGLGEGPPSPGEITARVLARCSRR
jgi:hypothetical protein